MISNIPLFLLNGVFYASTLFLIASGLTLIFSVAGILNLAHGALYMFGAFVGAYIIKVLSATHSYIVAFPIAAIVVGGIGVFIERFLLKWIYERPFFYQLLLTFGIALILGDLVRMIFGSQPISASTPFMRAGSISILGTPLSSLQLNSYSCNNSYCIRTEVRIKQYEIGEDNKSLCSRKRDG